MTETEPLIDVASIAGRYGVSLKSVYRFAAAAKLGQIVKTSQGMRFRQEAVEAYFKRPFVPPAPTKSDADIEPSPLKAPLTNADFLLVARGAAEQRDRQWQERLFSKNISIEPPPITAGPFRAYIDLQQFFTVTQVRELLDRAVRERDLAWRIWADDPLQRMQSPKGPGPFDWADLQPDKETSK
jgi:hypothetical protein